MEASFGINVHCFGRAIFWKPCNPSKRFYNGNIRAKKPEGYYILLQNRFGKHSLEYLHMPVQKLLMPGKKHATYIGKRSIFREMFGISLCISTVPRTYLFLK